MSESISTNSSTGNIPRRARRGLPAAAMALAAAAALTIGAAGSSTATIAAPQAKAAPRAAAAACPAPNLMAVGITTDGLTMASFWTNTPSLLNWVQDIQGLAAGAYAVGIDQRPQDNTLYLLDNLGNIYTVAITTTPQQAVNAVQVSKLTVKLDGQFFDIDHNPAANRLRVVSDTGQDLRHNLADHTTVADQPLNNGGVVANGVTAVAYTNNDLNGDTNTTLFDVDTTADQVVIQAPPNNGNLTATGKLTIDVNPNAGLDMYSELVGGRTVSNYAFATFQPVGGRYGLYGIDPLVGTANLIGRFPSVVQLADLALPIDTQ